MPITDAVVQVVHEGLGVREMVHMLMSRDTKSERIG
jgi:glycerol-3-phosphate dehydrogenase